MKPAIPSCSIVLNIALMLTLVIDTTTSLDLTPRRFHNEFRSCTRMTGEDGRCVDRSYCNEKYEIETGGIISDSELRIGECGKKGEWCCFDKNVITPPPPKPVLTVSNSSSTCIVTDSPHCPWCVLLYRDGKDRRRRESGFFCMGTLIGTRVILTTGTCMSQARTQNLWARFPSSADPNTNYTVKFRLRHPDYNSGTRENDLALLTIDPEPEWDNSSPKGACLGLEPNSLLGECFAAGINEDEKIRMMPLIVTPGNCGRGAASDSSCGNAIGVECSIVEGSPVICRPNDGPFMMTGQAKLPCLNDPPQSLLSNLVQAEKWLNERLKGTMGLMDKDYLKLSS